MSDLPRTEQRILMPETRPPLSQNAKEVEKLRARVRELEEVFQVTKEFCKLRGMWVQTFRADATSLLKRMAELTESGGVGDATNDN